MTAAASRKEGRRGDWVARLMASAALSFAALFAWGWVDAYLKNQQSQGIIIQLEGRLANAVQGEAVDAEILGTLLQKLAIVKTAHHDLMRRMSLLTKERAALAAAVESFYEVQVARHMMERSLSSLRRDLQAASPTGSGSEDVDPGPAVPSDDPKLKAIQQQIARQEDLIRRLILDAATRQSGVTAHQAEFDTLANQFNADLEMFEATMRDHLATAAAAPVGLAAVGGK